MSDDVNGSAPSPGGTGQVIRIDKGYDKFENRFGMTPQEMHEQMVFGPCSAPGCSLMGRIKITVYLPPDEIIKRCPELAGVLMSRTEDGTMPTAQMKDGSRMTPVSQVFACALHRQDAELSAAKAPSFAHVEIDRGPDPTNKISSSVSEKVGR